MNKAIIQLVLSGPGVTLAEAEEFASYLNMVMAVAGQGAQDGRKLEVGTITLTTGENDGG